MTTIYHNPRCSKSRMTLALLEERNVDVNIIEYLKTPLDMDQIDTLIDQLSIEPENLIRPKEAEYKEAGLSKTSSRAEIIAAIAQYPKLLERPIVVHNGKAKIGRPPENVLELF